QGTAVHLLRADGGHHRRDESGAARALQGAADGRARPDLARELLDQSYRRVAFCSDAPTRRIMCVTLPRPSRTNSSATWLTLDENVLSDRATNSFLLGAVESSTISCSPW